MSFAFAHNNFNVRDLNASLEFYRRALGLRETSRIEAADGSYILAFLGDEQDNVHKLELTWLRDRDRPYDLGDNEFHLAFTAPDLDAAHALHAQLGCICYENPQLGVYFISDPDGYWIEIIPSRK